MTVYISDFDRIRSIRTSRFFSLYILQTGHPKPTVVQVYITCSKGEMRRSTVATFYGIQAPYLRQRI